MATHPSACPVVSFPVLRYGIYETAADLSIDEENLE